jgi:opacity protein-like surface antigen
MYLNEEDTSVRKAFSLVFSIFLLSALAAAQVPRGNIFFGYSHFSADLNPNNRTGFNGWDGQLEGKVFPFIGIVADIGGYYGSDRVFLATIPPTTVSVDSKIYTVLFGPRLSVSVGRLTPFAHALFGAGHISDSASGFSDSDTSFATALGGGLDYKLIPAIAWRFQGDYLQTRFFSSTQGNARFSTGIVLRF